MRRLEFQAYIKGENEHPDVKNKIVKVLEIDFEGKEIIYKHKKTRWVSKFKNIELRQFTGFKDKNNKKIYEGDVIKIFDRYNVFVSRVKYHAGSFSIRLPEGYSYGPGIWSMRDIEEELEILGNIYENPDMAKVTSCPA